VVPDRDGGVPLLAPEDPGNRGPGLQCPNQIDFSSYSPNRVHLIAPDTGGAVTSLVARRSMTGGGVRVGGSRRLAAQVTAYSGSELPSDSLLTGQHLSVIVLSA
jgi:hypothetical protein